jgi:hypothetical protein
MHDQTNQISGDRERLVQRAIVAHTLRDDHSARWARSELEAELKDVDRLAIADALTRLQTEGVVELDGEIVLASSATRHLDALELIAL